MRRGFFFLLMVVLVLRGLTGTAMAAGIVAPLLPAGPAQHTVAHQPMAEGMGHDHSHVHDHSATLAQAEDSTPAHAHANANANAHHDGPAVEPAIDHTTASHSAACQDHGTGCPTHSDHDHHSASCSACEICHSAMLGLPASLTPAPLPARALLPLASAQFDSAPAALAIKPPIA